MLLAICSLFLINLVFAEIVQNQYKPQYVEVWGATGNVNSPYDTDPSSAIYSVTVNAGQPFIGKTEGANNSVDLGIWSVLLKEPDTPIVDASDGDIDYPDGIKISYIVDKLSPPVTFVQKTLGEINIIGEKWALYKQVGATSFEHRSHVSSEVNYFVDESNIAPGSHYNYGVYVSNIFGISSRGENVGFRSINGKIIGEVRVPGPNAAMNAPWNPPGNPVSDVEVSLSPIYGNSLNFERARYFVNINHNYNDELNSYLSTEFWFKNKDGFDNSHGQKILLNLNQKVKVVLLASDISFTVYTENNESITVNHAVPVNTQWHHFAGVYDGENVKIFLNGVLVESQPHTGEIRNSSPNLKIGRGDFDDNYYDGFLDDVRLWATPRSSREITLNKNRALDGDENGLVGYWRFDEGSYTTAYDRTSYKHDGALSDDSLWDENIPEVKISALTKSDGSYEIKGIWYNINEGTYYTVTPYKEHHEFFDPENRSYLMNQYNSSFTDANFLDKSLFSISGIVSYDNTNCPVVGAEIYIDGEPNNPEILTNELGEYSVDFEPGGGGVISAVFGGWEVYDTTGTGADAVIDTSMSGQHFMDTNHAIENIQSDEGNYNIVDISNFSLSGSVTGGTCQFPLPENSTVTLTSTPQCYENTTTTNSDGSFSFSTLPPLVFNVTVENIDPNITFEPITISLKDSSITNLDFIYRANIQTEIFDISNSNLTANDIENNIIPTVPRLCNSNPVNVVNRIQKYKLGFKTYEKYGSNECLIDSVIVQVIDDFTESTYTSTMKIPDTSTAYLAFTPLEPNIYGGGDHPYQKKIQIVVKDGYNPDRPSATDTYWAIVDGRKEKEGSNFETSTSEIPFFVLRKPPGDGSYTYFSESSESCTNIEIISEDTESNSGYATAHYGKEVTTAVGTVAGLGVQAVFTVSTKWSAQVDAGHGWDVTKTDIDNTSTRTCFTREESYSTSSDGYLTGDDATVFVGGGLSLAFSDADKITFNENAEECVDKTIVPAVTTKGVSSLYMHTRYYIEHTLMPMLAQDWAAIPQNPVESEYPSEGETGYDDFVKWKYWKVDVLDKDRTATLNAVVDSLFQFGDDNANVITYDSGVSYEYSITTLTENSNSTQIIVDDSDEFTFDGGVTIGGAGLSGGYAHVWNDVEDTTTTGIETNVSTTGFVLDDDDPGDGFMFEVKKDPIWGKPVFKILGGQSSCPWEPNTYKRQLAELSLSTSVIDNLPPTETAVITVEMINASETNQAWDYEFELLSGSNPDGLIIRYAGTPLNDPLEFESLPPGEALSFDLTIDRGPLAYDYENLQFRLGPLCEVQIGDVTGFYNNIDTENFSIGFIKPCSDVAIDLNSPQWFLNSNNNDTLLFTLHNYDRALDDLVGLRLEYTDFNDINWLVSSEIVKDSLTQDYVQLPFIAPADDGNYKIRAMAECELYDILPADQKHFASNYSQEYTGVVDRISPEPSGVMEPTDLVLGQSDEISITFNENLDCESIHAGSTTLYNSIETAYVDHLTSCVDRKITIMPDIPNYQIENDNLTAQVIGIKDVAGNPISANYSWEFTINRNPISWNSSSIEYIATTGDENMFDNEFSIELNNIGASSESFQLTNLPNWLYASPMEGEINSGGSYTINFNVNPNINDGTYSQSIIANCPEGDELLNVNLIAMCPSPEWQLNPFDFQYSMNLTAELSILDAVSSDVYDKLAAFVNGELRGVANIEYNESLDKHLVFLTIYSNIIAGEELEFRVWDRTNCTEFWGIDNDTILFGNNSTIGSLDNPLEIEVSGNVAQNFELQDGFTWISFNVEKDFSTESINEVLTSINAEEGDRIVSHINNDFIQYGTTTGWAGTLSSFDPGKMYLSDLSNSNSFQYIGTPIIPESRPIQLEQGWTWLGYLPTENMDISTALASLNPQYSENNLNIIKDRFNYAQYTIINNMGYWIGSLQRMQPSMGYKIYLSNADTLVYPNNSNRDSYNIHLDENWMIARNDNQDPIWSVDDYNSFEHTMVFTSVIESEEIGINDPNDVVGVFVGEEVRGVANPVYIPLLDEYRLFITVYGDNDDLLEFRIWDNDENQIYLTGESIPFEIDGIYGDITHPVIINKSILNNDIDALPLEFGLSQNYPNPFNPTTNIYISIPDMAKVSVSIYDINGRLVSELTYQEYQAGYQMLTWDGTNQMHEKVGSGIYFMVMEGISSTTHFRDTKKMVFLK